MALKNFHFFNDSEYLHILDVNDTTIITTSEIVTTTSVDGTTVNDVTTVLPDTSTTALPVTNTSTAKIYKSKVNIRMRFANLTWHPDMADKGSASYQNLALQLETYVSI